MRGRGGFIENVYVENVHMVGLRREAIVLNMFYGSSTAASRSSAPPAFRNIRLRNITCESAGVAVAIRGLPEQPIERVVLENLRLHAVEGVYCQDADDVTFNNVTITAHKEPLLSCSDVRRLNVTDLNLTKPEVPGRLVQQTPSSEDRTHTRAGFSVRDLTNCEEANRGCSGSNTKETKC
jgi:hypothetical protein